MARFGVDGLASYILSMEELAELPDNVMENMLDAGGDVLCGAIRESAETMLVGPYNKGAVAASVKKGRKSKIKAGRQLAIGFTGSQHGQPLARIAYVNEYGKKGQNARPFIRHAVEASADDVAQAEQKVYENYLDSKDL